MCFQDFWNVPSPPDEGLLLADCGPPPDNIKNESAVSSCQLAKRTIINSRLRHGLNISEAIWQSLLR